MSTESLAPDRRTDHPAPPKECRICAVCGEPSGSISAGTGKPLVRDKETGEMRHVSCALPSALPRDAAAALFAMVNA